MYKMFNVEKVEKLIHIRTTLCSLKLFGPSLSMSSDFGPSLSGPAFSFGSNENAGPDIDGSKSEDIDSDGPKSLSGSIA